MQFCHYEQCLKNLDCNGKGHANILEPKNKWLHVHQLALTLHSDQIKSDQTCIFCSNYAAKCDAQILYVLLPVDMNRGMLCLSFKCHFIPLNMIHQCMCYQLYCTQVSRNTRVYHGAGYTVGQNVQLINSQKKSRYFQHTEATFLKNSIFF